MIHQIQGLPCFDVDHHRGRLRLPFYGHYSFVFLSLVVYSDVFGWISRIILLCSMKHQSYRFHHYLSLSCWVRLGSRHNTFSTKIYNVNLKSIVDSMSFGFLEDGVKVACYRATPSGDRVVVWSLHDVVLWLSVGQVLYNKVGHGDIIVCTACSCMFK